MGKDHEEILKKYIFHVDGEDVVEEAKFIITLQKSWFH